MKITDVRIVIGASIQVRVQLDRIGLTEKECTPIKDASGYLEAFFIFKRRIYGFTTREI